jgi:hypothetical protein
MAIKVGGTTVINDSRQLSNIASVDAATVTALSDAGVGGSGLAALEYKNANYTMSSGEGIVVDCTSASRTITLPASPAIGDRVIIMDSGVTWNQNSLTIDAGTGKLINKLASESLQTFTYTSSYKLELVYTVTNVWALLDTQYDTGVTVVMFLPTSWSSPSETITSSRTYTNPNGKADTELVWILLNSNGGAGNYNTYQANWSFAGTGGSAGLFLTSTAMITGASMSVAGTRSTGTSWQPNNTLTASTVTLGDNTVVTSGVNQNNGTRQVHHSFKDDLTGGSTTVTDAYISASKPVTTATNTNIGKVQSVSNERFWGGSQDVAGQTRTFGGGDGYSSNDPLGAGGPTQDSSLFSGDGGGNSSPGIEPSGGGGGRNGGTGTNNIGARGQIRLYFASDN